MIYYKCKICGGDLVPSEDNNLVRCEYCQTLSTVPNEKEEQRVMAFNRANKLRINCDFDRAIQAYERLIAEDGTDAELYWNLLICKYGIEYVKDPVTEEYKPTCHRAHYGSFLTDVDYKEVIERADMQSRIFYEKEAARIDEILQQILVKALQQEKYSVFLSYKETDNGERTLDSVGARSIYTKLNDKGIKTFYAPESLHLGTNYEAEIFSAIHSAKVMIVLGSKTEYFNAPWVRNEWSRYLALIKNGEDKYLIPAFWDLDPQEDLPKEIASLHLQGVNLATPVGEFALLEYVEKLVGGGEQKQKTTETVVSVASPDQASADSLAKRARIFLENGEFADALDYYNRVLDIQPENAAVYWGQLLAKRKCCSSEELIAQGKQIDEDMSYRNAIRFADSDLKEKYLAVHEAIMTQKQSMRDAVKAKMQEAIQASVDKIQDYLEEFESTIAGMKEVSRQVEGIESNVQMLVNQVVAERQPYDAERMAVYNQVSEIVSNMNSECSQGNGERAISAGRNFKSLRLTYIGMQDKLKSFYSSNSTVKQVDSAVSAQTNALGECKKYSQKCSEIYNKFSAERQNIMKYEDLQRHLLRAIDKEQYDEVKRSIGHL